MFTPTSIPTGSKEPHVQIASRIPATLLKAVKKHCVNTDQTLTTFLRNAFERLLATEKQKTRKAA